ncbi:hypothetical protein ACS78O_16750 [Yersinia enterocolitica]|uniref:hypothetical protein n=1 Tax=Yersinia enterocolitica TaxID=630 RepID=UPI002A7B58C0|nr:hypothetical protein [Yersinia enterocolitica]
MNNIEEIIVSLKTRVALAELIGPDEMIVSASDLSTLIAQLEAAQKERDDLREKVNQADSEWHKMADRILSAGKRAEKAEAALSAANEKLKGEQVPVAVIVLSKNWPDTGRKVIDYYIEKIQHLPVGTELFTAPQKPVVLSSSTVMSRAYVVQAIKAAGSTVEGE